MSVFILNVNMSGAKGVSLLDTFLFFWWIWQGGDGEGDGIISSPHHFNLFFFLHDAVVIGPGLQLQGLEAGIIPKQETKFLTFMSDRIPKGLMG